MDRYEQVEALLERYREGGIDQEEFHRRVKAIWLELETSSDPAERLLQKILVRTSDLTRGRMTQEDYEKFLREVRTDWLGDGAEEA